MMKRLALAAFALLVAAASPAVAQVTASGPWQPINPNGGTVTLSVTAAGVTTQLAQSATTGGAPAPETYVCNQGVNTAYLIFSANANLTPTATGFPLFPAACNLFNTFQQGFAAAISPNGVTTLALSSGSGIPAPQPSTAIWTPINPNGSTVTLAANNAASANVALATNAGALAPVLYACNSGPNIAYVTDGTGPNVVVTASAGFPMAVGGCYWFNSAGSNFAAGITSTGSATLTFTSGTGNPVSYSPTVQTFLPVSGAQIFGQGNFGSLFNHQFPQGWIQTVGPLGTPVFLEYY
jgi:hypothetical protein